MIEQVFDTIESNYLCMSREDTARANIFLSLLYSVTLWTRVHGSYAAVWCGLRGLRSQGNWIELQIGPELVVGLQAAADRGFPFYRLLRARYALVPAGS